MHEPVRPIGAVVAYAASGQPTGYLLCDGREISRILFADLFHAIGERWGEGDGATTFRVPDVPATDGLTWLIYTGVVRG